MSVKKISDGIFEAAPAVLFITCTAGAIVSGARYIISRNPVSRLIFTINTAGIMLSTIAHMANKVFEKPIVKDIKKDDTIDADISKDA